MRGASGKLPKDLVGFRITHYQRLEVHRGATAAEIKEAWRKLSRKVHPDANVIQQNKAEQEEQGALFAALSESYSVLKDPKRRNAYDKQLDATGDKCEKCGGRGFTSKTKGFTARETIPCQVCGATGRILRGDGLAPENGMRGGK